MSRLIDQGADVDHVLKVMMYWGVEKSFTPLTVAAVKGLADAVRVLISRNADVNKQDSCDGFTALHLSAEGGHVPVIQLLISKGARTDVRDTLGQTPLQGVIRLQAVDKRKQQSAFLIMGLISILLTKKEPLL
jgi:hypothetical protein